MRLAFDINYMKSFTSTNYHFAFWYICICITQHTLHWEALNSKSVVDFNMLWQLVMVNIYNVSISTYLGQRYSTLCIKRWSKELAYWSTDSTAPLFRGLKGILLTPPTSHTKCLMYTRQWTNLIHEMFAEEVWTEFRKMKVSKHFWYTLC